VNSAKFAAVTASLLARKGDAVPSVVVPVRAPPRPALAPRNDQLASLPRQPDNPEKLRRIMVPITQEELERLCIAAIKKGTKRHDIVREALIDYFRKFSAELPYPCACMEGGPVVAAPHAQSKPGPAGASYPACAENLDSEIPATRTAEDQVAI
jgi:hypothetical protein